MCNPVRSGISLKLAIACVSIALTAGGGCVGVDSNGDFRNTSDQIRQHTGAEQVYDPDGDAGTAEKVNDLLAGGLTEEEAVSVALLNNPTFQALFQEIGACRADVVQSGLLSNPTLSLGFRLVEGGGRAEITGSLAQQIVDLWQIPVRKRIAEAQLQRTVAVVVEQATRVAAEVRARYYRVLAGKRAEELSADNMALIQQALDVAQARLRAGDAGPLDVNLVRMNLLDAEIERQSAERDRVVAEVALAGALGLSRSNAPLTLAGALPQPLAPEHDEAELQTVATEQRLDLRAARLAVTSAENELERECRNVFPSIVLGINGERTERRAMPGRDILADTLRSSVTAGTLTAPSIQPRSEREQARRQFIDSLLGATVSITLPIWDQNQARIARARFEVIRRRKLLDAVAEAAAQQVRESLVRSRAARELAVLFDQEVLPQAVQNLEGAQSLYRTGEQGILPLIESQETLVRQRRRHVTVLQEYALAMVDLELAVGGRLPPSDGATEESPTQGDSE
ncbi:MAG: TolC family protein [Phycisphaerales bacterium]|nr:TolC family protein [Phycisphaerales bacterium]